MRPEAPGFLGAHPEKICERKLARDPRTDGVSAMVEIKEVDTGALECLLDLGNTAPRQDAGITEISLVIPEQFRLPYVDAQHSEM
ncbi:hypothetical protein GCM10011488_01650 [Steroidobacter agaridevorans]|nr:hypothetical protein GCM10011488_01650 [Steroidobacter agaridevorans]